MCLKKWRSQISERLLSAHADADEKRQAAFSLRAAQGATTRSQMRPAKNRHAPRARRTASMLWRLSLLPAVARDRTKIMDARPRHLGSTAF